MSLRDLGLDEATEHAYRWLLDAWEPRVADLAAATGHDHAAASAIVDTLAGFGLLRREDELIVVAEPGAAVGSLIEAREEASMRLYRKVAATRAELTDLSARFAASADRSHVDEGAVERIEDVSEIRDKIEEVAFFARRSVYGMHPDGAYPAEALEAARPLDLRALRRGIDLRMLHDRRVLEGEAHRRYLAEMVVRGAQVRISDDVAHRMILMDGEVAIVPIDLQDASRGALVVRHPMLLTGFNDLFERTWAAAVPFDDSATAEPAAAGSDAVPDLDRAVMRLLAQGTTDEVAAKELGISVRHLRRHIARIIDDLGAPSRFAAGAEAARRGWI